MAGDELREDHAEAPEQPTVDRLRHRLRAIAIIVVLVLFTVRVLVPPTVIALGGPDIDDDGAVLFTLAGTLLVLLGLEVPSFIAGGRR